ncbi:GNAT family N-acetyltransferase [Pseudarthrobacter psychrotolerans]|uniref:GNAT family N-acetyltransferase n=1 Tax=Pseudarthrobacter psychrotolerans TaxID=2697569 RepID=A0A6P1NHM1_9MICC|nr:GNAT family N-acetyltransferase [Pseudarthrobacter psychrotolerans]QHK20115.1 GNAT family N-acetyltransferase [Pseudarthrobacter psychrotolerans]
MDFNGFADRAKKDAKHDAGTVAVVRPAGPAVFEAIAAIEQASGRGPLSPSALAAAVADPERHVLVATADGAVIGWGKTHYWDHDDGPAPSGHYLGGVTVLPEWRRLGVGAAMTAARLRWVWARASEAWYVVNAENLASIELHRRWNFTEVARGPRFHTTTFTGGLGLLMCAAGGRSSSGCLSRLLA